MLALFTENASWGMRVQISFNLLVRVTQKFFPLKMSDGAGIKNLLQVNAL